MAENMISKKYISTESSNAWCYICKLSGNTTLLISYRSSTKNHKNRSCESALFSLGLYNFLIPCTYKIETKKKKTIE